MKRKLAHWKGTKHILVGDKRRKVKGRENFLKILISHNRFIASKKKKKIFAAVNETVSKKKKKKDEKSYFTSCKSFFYFLLFSSRVFSLVSVSINYTDGKIFMHNPGVVCYCWDGKVPSWMYSVLVWVFENRLWNWQLLDEEAVEKLGMEIAA